MKTVCTIVSIAGIALSLAGCGTGAPRFANSEESRTSTKQRESSVRFSRELQRAAREERTEDDVSVDVANVERRIVHPTRQQTMMLREILRHIGTPYRLGGTGTDGIDCSAYTLLVFRNAMNIELPRSTAEQYAIGRSVGISNKQFGDLIFFNTTGRNPSHVGIYIGDNLFAHASLSYGVTISSLESSYYQRRVTAVRRILQ
jgi:cell wall-associated NlpC family hydrolase